jgi:hypothetical protein
MRRGTVLTRATLLSLVAALGLGSLLSAAQTGSHPGSGFHTVLSSAMRYVMNYEQQFALLALDEHYAQELQRPPNPAQHLAQSSPGSGMSQVAQQTFKSDLVLVQLGMDGEGWMPFRDTYDVKGKKVRDSDDRLLKLFLANDRRSFEKAADYTGTSNKHHLGQVARTINIPTLGMLLLHPRVNERFEFTDGGEETAGGRVLRKAMYREVARPTLVKTTRGLDLALTGTIWIEPFSGAVVKTEMNAADPALRCQVTVTFRRDQTLEMWVPERMEEYYRVNQAADDIFATATYTNVRKYRRSDLER